MSISIGVNAEFKIGTTIYSASMGLPKGAPTGGDPLRFQVTSAAGDKPDDKTPLLTVAVGGKDQIYIAVQPPTNLIAAAAGDGIVQKLDVVAKEGDYDTGTGMFTTPERVSSK